MKILFWLLLAFCEYKECIPFFPIQLTNIQRELILKKFNDLAWKLICILAVSVSIPGEERKLT